MWRWKLPVIILSIFGFLVGLCLSIGFPIDMDREGDDQDSRRALSLYFRLTKPIGSGSYNEGYYGRDTREGWGKKNSALQGGMNYEDWIGTEIAHRPKGVSNLSEEERAKLYDRLGREMHLLQDMSHSSPDSLSLSP